MISRDGLAREVVVTVDADKIGTFDMIAKRLARYGPTQVAQWTIGRPRVVRSIRVYRLAEVPPPELIAALNARGVRIERNVALGLAAVPNDRLYAEQWALPHISAEAAWQCIDTTALPPPVTVAVVDSGIARAHPDLAGRIDPASRRFILAMPDTRIEDDDGHGTFLGGTIAAITNNLTGIASVPGPLAVNLLALKFYDPWTPLAAANAARAITYAVDHGAHVINASWHVGIESPILQTAIEYAAQNDVVFVAACGNEGTNNDELPVWPASYPLANIISVMASDRHDDKPAFSNYGPTTVHLAAPGVGVLGTHHYWRTPQYRNYGGTSAAAAHVAAAAAIVKALRPAMSAVAIKAHLIASVDHDPYLKCVARGRLNLERVVCQLP